MEAIRVGGEGRPAGGDLMQRLGHIAGGVRFEGGDWLTLVSGCPVEEIYRSFSFCLFCI